MPSHNFLPLFHLTLFYMLAEHHKRASSFPSWLPSLGLLAEKVVKFSHSASLRDNRCSALAPTLACVILDIRAALWREGGWVAAGRNGKGKGWMIGGLEKGWIGTSCCNLSAFSSAIGSWFPHFPPAVSLRLSSHSLLIRAISLILACVCLTLLQGHLTNVYSIAQHAWEHGGPWLLHAHTQTQPTLPGAHGGVNLEARVTTRS